MTEHRSPEVGDPILYHSQDVIDPNPAPGVVDAVYDHNIIDCTITLADESTQQETEVRPAPKPNEDYYRYWTFS